MLSTMSENRIYMRDVGIINGIGANGNRYTVFEADARRMNGRAYLAIRAVDLREISIIYFTRG